MMNSSLLWYCLIDKNSLESISSLCLPYLRVRNAANMEQNVRTCEGPNKKYQQSAGRCPLRSTSPRRAPLFLNCTLRSLLILCLFCYGAQTSSIVAPTSSLCWAKLPVLFQLSALGLQLVRLPQSVDLYVHWFCLLACPVQQHASAQTPVRFLNVHEYIGQDIFRQYGVPVPEGAVATTPAEAEELYTKMTSGAKARECFIFTTCSSDSLCLPS